HHINSIRSDNRIENLKLVSKSQHKKEHQTERRFGNFIHRSGTEVVTIPKKVKILNIIDNGEREVFDVVMSEPHRNFVANGFVVHNCGKSIQALGVVKHLSLH